MTSLKKKFSIRYFFIILDFFFLYLSVYLASYIHWNNFIGWSLNSRFLSNIYIYLLLINIVIFYFQGLYNPNKFINSGSSLIKIFYSQFLITIFHVFLAFYTDNILYVSRYFIFYYLFISAFLLFLYRYFLLLLIKPKINHNNVTIVGNRHEIDKIMENKALFYLAGIKLYTYISTDSFNNNIVTNDYELDYLGNINQIENIIKKNKIDKIIIAESELKTNNIDIIKSLKILKKLGIDLDIIPEIYEFAFGKINLSSDVVPVLGVNNKKNEFYIFIKTLFDYSVSFLGMLLSFPLLLICSILIILESKGKPIYTQKRVGKNNKVFNIYKLRTMRQDAEKNGPQFSSGKKDSRITKFGYFLRKTRIDELPQLFSVLQGNMSLIGPRPERPEFVDDFEKNIDYYGIRHSVKPGITGWAQIMYSYTIDEKGTKEKLKYDLYYIKNMSIEMDIKIILKTISTILRMKGR